eukprot:6462044-Amphidinium_carterae.1
MPARSQRNNSRTRQGQVHQRSKDARRSVLVVDDAEICSTDSDHRSSSAKKRAERKKTKKEQEQQQRHQSQQPHPEPHQRHATQQHQHPQPCEESPDDRLDKLLEHHKREQLAASLFPPPPVAVENGSPNFAGPCPFHFMPSYADMARHYACPQPPTPPPPAPPPQQQAFCSAGKGGLDIDSLRALLRETVQESISPLQSSMSTLEKRVLALEQKETEHDSTFLVPPVAGKGEASARSACAATPPWPHPPAQNQTQYVQQVPPMRRPSSHSRSVPIPEKRAHSRPASGKPRDRSTPPTQDTDDMEPHHTKRMSRLVLGKLPEPLSRDEMYEKVNSLLPLPEDCRVLVRARYSTMATLVFPNPKQANDYLALFRQEERKLQGSKIFLAREKTMEQQRVGYILRESRRQMVELGVDGRAIELEERSCSLFVRRHAVVVVRDGKVVISDSWEKHVAADPEEFLQAMGTSLG